MRMQLVVMKPRKYLIWSVCLVLTLVALALSGGRAAAVSNYTIAQLRSGSLDNEWRDINNKSNGSLESAQPLSAYIRNSQAS
jgi:hypothetical protein